MTLLKSMKCFIYDRISEWFGVFVEYLDTSFMFEFSLRSVNTCFMYEYFLKYLWINVYVCNHKQISSMATSIGTEVAEFYYNVLLHYYENFKRKDCQPN